MKCLLLTVAVTALTGLSQGAFAQQAQVAAALPDPSEFEIVAVAPRSPDVKPIMSSLPAAPAAARSTRAPIGHEAQQTVALPSKGDRSGT